MRHCRRHVFDPSSRRANSCRLFLSACVWSLERPSNSSWCSFIKSGTRKHQTCKGRKIRRSTVVMSVCHPHGAISSVLKKTKTNLISILRNLFLLKLCHEILWFRETNFVLSKNNEPEKLPPTPAMLIMVQRHNDNTRASTSRRVGMALQCNGLFSESSALHVRVAQTVPCLASDQQSRVRVCSVACFIHTSATLV